MSEQLNLGQIITTPQHRDAIHIAVVPCKAGQKLQAGDKVWMEGGVARHGAIGSIGVVDPFLSVSVAEGQTFWLYLNPGSITSLRHEWTHPAFPVGAAYDGMGESERWIREFADRIPLAYATLLEGAADYVRSKKRGGYGDYLCFGGLLEGEYVPDEFWPHYENVTGEKVDEDHRGSFFTCSC